MVKKFIQKLTFLVLCAGWSICCLDLPDVKADDDFDLCIHCCCGVRNRSRDFNLKREYTSYSYQEPIWSHPKPIATTSTGISIYSGSGSSSVTGYRTVHRGYFTNRYAFELSCDGLFCGFLGWLNFSRYCKYYPGKNVDSLSEPACDACWISSESRPAYNPPQAPKPQPEVSVDILTDPIIPIPIRAESVDHITAPIFPRAGSNALGYGSQIMTRNN